MRNEGNPDRRDRIRTDRDPASRSPASLNQGKETTSRDLIWLREASS